MAEEYSLTAEELKTVSNVLRADKSFEESRPESGVFRSKKGGDNYLEVYVNDMSLGRVDNHMTIVGANLEAVKGLAKEIFCITKLNQREPRWQAA